MTDNTNIVTVECIDTVVHSDWFLSALREESYDAIVVLAHMHYSDALVESLLEGFRAVVSDVMPIQFLTGKYT